MDPLFIWTSSFLLAAVFAYGAYGKLSAWGEFTGVVHNFKILPRWLSPAFSVALPIIEVVVALALLVPQIRTIGAYGSFALLTLFVVAIAINLKRGRNHIDCGCFRTNVAQPISIWMILRNVTLMAISLAPLMDTSTQGMDTTRWLTAGVSASTLFLLYLAVTMVTAPAPPTYEENFYASRKAA